MMGSDGIIDEKTLRRDRPTTGSKKRTSRSAEPD
eukprot:CAMPEP_0183406626 /NCGR_PEP_ID=MMETSP0370-20130417/16738_1 /TAXON_ID=268820 /ORGANISM="Peridinium aciculiferum, Strain PAER-2" /LENGTH=33 /DNA_ID= /DNA_START= /DNA_END= /DNA_ORIENTATION=